MRSAATGTGSPPSDTTARARIRDAAIARYGRDGFGASLRTVAADAGVSAGLVIHHFGTKAGLRVACDEHVTRVVREAKTQTLTGGPGNLLAQLATMDEYGDVLGYVLAGVAAGGDTARRFFEQVVDDAVEYLRLGVATGTIRPSRDEAARARYLALTSLGAVLLHRSLSEGARYDPATGVREYLDVVGAPALELFTQGMLTDSSLLDAYVAHTEASPAEPAHTQGER
ncbi:TetR/AcrR family transcriptional regulator [Cellulomonas sp. PhB143]|uniref:TetR/AcrR family transcriptional regulator n=1 Tax=Cellulomonas sp. PhB143 TaxID=2485186 RepID=UPI000F46F351|nr:TetR family transcriptional regulator [Cellulomonas sp. PhB143]ROS78933.1 TetR family transcriptional regulator [Cellulomonas sp. PhB143]